MSKILAVSISLASIVLSSSAIAANLSVRCFVNKDVIQPILSFEVARNESLRLVSDLIRVLTDQNPFAHSLRPMDMMRQGWLSSFRQASQQ